jgi:drug/metabolite transporter (DMT)-like permease
MTIMSKLIIFLYVITTSLGLIILKLSTGRGSPVELIAGKLHFNVNALTLTGIVLYGVSFFLYIFLISKFNLGYIIPLTTALVYIIIFTASFIIFKETFTVLKIAAICLIVIGVILLNIKQ